MSEEVNAAASSDNFVAIVAIDDSEHSWSALEYYLKCVHHASYTVLLVHCIEIPYQPVQPIRAEIVDDILLKCRSDAKVVEDKFEKVLKEHGVKYRMVSEFGKAGEFICKTTEAENARLIVMGTRGMGKLRRTIMGSVSDFVVHHAPCPVLIYRTQHDHHGHGHHNK